MKHAIIVNTSGIWECVRHGNKGKILTDLRRPQMPANELFAALTATAEGTCEKHITKALKAGK